MRFAILSACALAPVACLFVACSQPTAPDRPAETVITLQGEGEVKRIPDKATVWAGVQVRRPTGAEAMRVQAEQTTKVIAALKAAGVADIDMQTTDLSLQPDINYGKGPRLRGYIATNFVRVTIRNLPKLGETMDEVVKAGGVIERQLVFDVEAKGGALNEARQAAIKDAMAKADLYAAAIGYKVKRVISVTEPGMAIPYQPYPQQVAPQEYASPIQTGQVSSGAVVNVTFDLSK